MKMDIKMVLALFLLDVTAFVGSEVLICKLRVQKGCKCDYGVNITAYCKIDDLCILSDYLTNTRVIKELEHSNNNLQAIPPKIFSNFTELAHLNLASNRLQIILEGAFYGLTNLRTLKLQDNSIKNWNIKGLSKDLPNLEVLNIGENPYLMLDKNIIHLPKIRRVNFLNIRLPRVSLRLNCFLERKSRYKFGKNKRIFPFSQWNLFFDSCVFTKIVIDQPQLLNITPMYNFEHVCKLKSESLKSEPLNEPSRLDGGWYHTDIHNICWAKVNTVYIFTTSLGILTFLFNMIVISTVVRSKTLRGSVAHVLIANVATGDLLISIYIITLTLTRQSVTYNQYYVFREKFCNIVGVFILVGMFISPLMTFMVTLERYLAIVYCMNSNLKITLKHVYITMATAWSFAITFAISFMLFPMLSETTDYICVPSANSSGIKIIEFPVAFLGLLYVISIILYCHIYFNVKKTSQRTEQLRKDSSLARKIVLIIITNVLFWVIPLLTTTLIGKTSLEHYFTGVSLRILFDSIALTCLVTNSCLNPVLFSFRNQLFRSEFSKQWNIKNNDIVPTNS